MYISHPILCEGNLSPVIQSLDVSCDDTEILKMNKQSKWQLFEAAMRSCDYSVEKANAFWSTFIYSKSMATINHQTTVRDSKLTVNTVNSTFIGQRIDGRLNDNL